MALPPRRIIVYRNPPPNILDWSYYIVEPWDDIDYVIFNMKKQGIHQYSTYDLGPRHDNYSSEY